MSNITSYRTPQAQLSDSDSSGSDDEDQPWKRQKKYTTSKRETPMVVSSVRDGAVPSRSTSSSLKRKRNNIWADVVQQQEEDQVARDITQFDMYSSKERDVESYSYQIRQDSTATKQQPLGNPVSYDDTTANQNRKVPEALGGSKDDAWLVDDGEGHKTGLKDRLGPRGDDMNSKGTTIYENDMKYVKLNPDMHRKEVAGEIAYSLQEPKRDMVKTVVAELGVEKTIAVWKETWEMEQNGGMMVNNGSRRRTPGGVFFQLLKTDNDISKEKKEVIFAMSTFQSKQDGKSRRRRTRRKQRTNAMETNHADGDGDEMNVKPDEESGRRDENIHETGEMGEEIKKQEQGVREEKDNPLINKVDRTIEETEAERIVISNSEIKETTSVQEVETDIKLDMEEGEISD